MQNYFHSALNDLHLVTYKVVKTKWMSSIHFDSLVPDRGYLKKRGLLILLELYSLGLSMCSLPMFIYAWSVSCWHAHFTDVVMFHFVMLWACFSWLCFLTFVQFVGLQWVPILYGFLAAHRAISGRNSNTMAARRPSHKLGLLERRWCRIWFTIADLDQWHSTLLQRAHTRSQRSLTLCEVWRNCHLQKTASVTEK